ncbi:MULTISPECIES: hypothetical protein [Niastella]|uniref:Uncharacterized protein n=1 Tax=Niastella soli TaxID=2821487 RepID=A0ABS3Z141_9BACT|nr:hypothetical protein [Niastella soli]MBO9203873.1 hypothetical protein [Niastella soli]
MLFPDLKTEKISEVSTVKTTRVSPVIGAKTQTRASYLANSLMGKMGSAAVSAPIEKQAAQVKKTERYVKAKYYGMAIKTPNNSSPGKVAAQPAPPANPELVTETFALDGVWILAYVCKRVPLAPNPAPDLHWP